MDKWWLRYLAPIIIGIPPSLWQGRFPPFEALHSHDLTVSSCNSCQRGLDNGHNPTKAYNVESQSYATDRAEVHK